MSKKWEDFLKVYREKSNFDPESWVKNKCSLFNNYLRTTDYRGQLFQ